MEPNHLLPTRLRASSPGLGQGSQFEVEQRAEELAVSDGREKATDGDLAMAAAELAGGGTTLEAPEADAAFTPFGAWEKPVVQTGHLDVTASSEDEDTIIAEQLIGNGLEEAEHDTRVAAELERKKNQ